MAWIVLVLVLGPPSLVRPVMQSGDLSMPSRGMTSLLCNDVYLCAPPFARHRTPCCKRFRGRGSVTFPDIAVDLEYIHRADAWRPPTMPGTTGTLHCSSVHCPGGVHQERSAFHWPVSARTPFVQSKQIRLVFRRGLAPDMGPLGRTGRVTPGLSHQRGEGTRVCTLSLMQ